MFSHNRLEFLNRSFDLSHNSQDVSTKTSESSNDSLLPLFLKLYNAHYRKMYFYAKTLIPAGESIEDILQESSLAMWAKFSSFNQELEFLPWALGVIHIEILRLKRKRRTNKQFLFDEEYIELISKNYLGRSQDKLDARYDFLLECVKALPSKFRQIIFDRYYLGMKTDEIGAKIRKSQDMVYQLLSRARKILKNCVSEKMRRLY